MGSAKIGALLAVVLGSLSGCGAMPDENVDTVTAGLTTDVFRLHNFQTNFCLGVRAGTPTVYNNMIVWDCDGSANQNFQQQTPSGIPAPFVELKNFVADDRCLAGVGTVSGTSSNGSAVIIYNCGTVPAIYLEWNPVLAGNDFDGHQCFQFVSAWKDSKGKDLVLGVLGGSTQRGTSAVLWNNFNDRFGHPDQFWCAF
jgi:hypothetical protein